MKLTDRGLIFITTRQGVTGFVRCRHYTNSVSEMLKWSNGRWRAAKHQIDFSREASCFNYATDPFKELWRHDAKAKLARLRALKGYGQHVLAVTLSRAGRPAVKALQFLSIFDIIFELRTTNYKGRTTAKENYYSIWSTYSASQLNNRPSSGINAWSVGTKHDGFHQSIQWRHKDDG